MRRLPVLLIALAVLFGGYCLPIEGQESIEEIKIGSKKFTENVILGEVLTRLAANTKIKAVHRKELGGTQVLWNALLRGDIDAYPEYTGTISQEILAGSHLTAEEDIRNALAEKGIVMSPPLGFNNTYAIGMKRDVAAKYNIRTISDLRKHPQLKLGFSNEFMDRGDGWGSLRDRYRLPQTNVRGLDHDLAYRGLESSSIDAIDLYSTDAEIAYYDLHVLEDDLRYFPQYNAVILYRSDLRRRAPGVVAEFMKLTGRIPASEMVKMNRRAKLDKVPESAVAADFLKEQFDLRSQVKVETMFTRIFKHTLEHLSLVGISLFAAILMAIPLGILAAKTRWPQLGQAILGIVGIIQTIPALALLVFMIPLLGIGGPPAIVALFLYSLLPIVRNTHAGLNSIPPQLLESAAALGLPPAQRLRRVELPMASRSILAGIKTSAVINIGTATLGALIGAGGYGQPILTGIRLDDTGLILQGAVPAALLAIVVQLMFEIAERLLVPKGLRLKPERP
ncbi:MAG: ABC transporter permease subunit [bacterium]|nr:ABC transporter permease subunit [bacterium]